MTEKVERPKPSERDPEEATTEVARRTDAVAQQYQQQRPLTQPPGYWRAK